MQEVTTGLVRHGKREEWGLAVMAWERGKRRAYQFEDGKLRIFREGYFHFLVPAVLAPDEARKRASTLRRQAGVARQARQASISGAPKVEPSVSFADQVLLFRHLYPEGFLGERWTEELRGEGVKRPRKGHRERVLAKASELLDPDQLESLAPAEQLAALVKVFKLTDLVATKDVKALAAAGEEVAEGIAGSLPELLREGSPTAFTRYVNALYLALDKTPAWSLVTAPCALYQPSEHVCVKGSSFREQAKAFAPKLSARLDPAAHLYHGYRDLARGVHQALVDAGCQPRDLVDVHDFVKITLRPKNLEQLDEARRKAAKTEAA